MKFILLIFAFILSVNALVAQKVDSTEIRVDSTVYMKYVGHQRIYIETINPQIKNVPANYDTHENGYKINFSDKNIIVKLIKKWFTPFFIEHGVPTDVPSYLNNIVFTFHSDMDGKIIGVDFLFFDKNDILIQFLPHFSHEIQKSNLKLMYNKKDQTFKHAKRLLRIYAMSSSDIYNLK